MATRAAKRERGRWPLGTKLAVELYGAHPVPKGSMKAFTPTWKPGQKTRPIATVTDSKTPELRALEHHMRELAIREMDRRRLPCAQEQPFEILIAYYLARPNGDFSKASGDLLPTARVSPWVKPDLSKLVRATEDAFTGLVWDDDSRIVRTVTEKRYATRERDIGLWIEVRVQPATLRELAELRQLSTIALGG